MATEPNSFDLWADDLEDEEIEIPHDFEIDLNCVITANHSLTMEGIERTEDKALDDIYEGFENRETVNSIAGQAQNFYDDLRRTARLLALVGLVTRLQHWISRFA